MCDGSVGVIEQKTNKKLRNSFQNFLFFFFFCLEDQLISRGPVEIADASISAHSDEVLKHERLVVELGVVQRRLALGSRVVEIDAALNQRADHVGLATELDRNVQDIAVGAIRQEVVYREALGREGADVQRVLDPGQALKEEGTAARWRDVPSREELAIRNI